MKHRHRTLQPAEFTLDNALPVVLVRDPRLPAVALHLSILSGASDESGRLAGLAALVSRLLDEGTETRSSLEIAEAIESVGGAIECDCSHERTSVSLSVLGKDLDLGIDLVADIVQHPVFQEESFRNERARTLAEIRSVMDRPQVVAGWAFDELVYAGHPLGRPVQGYPETIEEIARPDLMEFHERHFVPENALLSVVGDFDLDSIGRRIETAFGGWPAGRFGDKERPELPSRRAGVQRRRLAVSSQQAHVYLGHLGVVRNDPDFYALQVMDTILGAGAGLNSRLPRRLRDDQGLAYTTFASITSSSGLSPGKFIAYIGTAPENVDQCIREFLEEIERIRSEPVEPEELEDAKSYLTGSFVFGFESNAQVARFLTNARIYGLGYDFVEKYPALIESVTIDEVQRVAARHLSTEDYSLVVAGPSPDETGRNDVG